MKDISYSINQHDSDGDRFDECLLLHFENSFIIRLSDINDLSEMIKKLQAIQAEIKG